MAPKGSSLCNRSFGSHAVAEISCFKCKTCDFLPFLRTRFFAPQSSYLCRICSDSVPISRHLSPERVQASSAIGSLDLKWSRSYSDSSTVIFTSHSVVIFTSQSVASAVSLYVCLYIHRYMSRYTRVPSAAQRGARGERRTKTVRQADIL